MDHTGTHTIEYQVVKGTEDLLKVREVSYLVYGSHVKMIV
jgi:hypothetical protein